MIATSAVTMSLLRPLKDNKRSNSVNEAALASRSNGRIPTPFLRHESVVEVVEKKQREGLKNRLKMLHTGVLPSRSLVPTNLPVIVKAPIRTATLQRNPPRKAHYQSVLALNSDSVPTTTEEKPRLTRRHSVGGLFCTQRDANRSPNDINGNNFKIGNFYSDRFPGNRDKLNNADNKLTGVSNAGTRAKFLIAKDDNYLDKESPIFTFKPLSTTERGILTKPAANEKLKEMCDDIGAKVNGDCMKSNDDDEVFSLPNNAGDFNLDENRIFEQKNTEYENPVVDCKINGDEDCAVKPDGSGPDTVEIPEDVFQTNPESPNAAEEFCTAELNKDRNGESRDSEDDSQRSSFSSAILVDIDDSINTTSSASLLHSNGTFENGLEKPEEHNLATTKLTLFPDIVISCEGETETHTILAKVEDDMKLEESSASYEERENAGENGLLILAKVEDDMKLEESSASYEQRENAGENGLLILAKVEDDLKLEESSASYEERENAGENRLLILAKVEDDMKLEESSASYEERENAGENGLNENAESKATGLVTNGEHDFSEESNELSKNDDKNTDESDAFWSAIEDSLSGLSKPTPDESNSELNEANKDERDACWSVVEESLTGSIDTTSSKSRPEAIEVEIVKCPDFGLGFCIEGGKGSPLGDRPITVKRVFQASTVTQKRLKDGDEILTFANKDTSTMTHIEAWRLLRSLPDGPVKMTIIRKED